MGFTMTTEELIAYLILNGFHKELGGRHQIMMVRDGLRIPIPAHSGDLKKGTVNEILKKSGSNTKKAKKWKEGR
jgi:predicted RNA binding protein YcfA (HicA-like mRNA interferase family)